MKPPFRLIRRRLRTGISFYCFDTRTRKRTALGASSLEDARRLIIAKNEAEHQPMLNLQIARAYLYGADGSLANRTWQEAMQAITESKSGANKHRWETAAKDRAFRPLLPLKIVETKGETLLQVLRAGTVSTNNFLRRLHNFCVDMTWLPWPLIPKRQWPAIRHKEKRAITADEHARIVERERNPERKAFYQLAWHIGAAQHDLAHLNAEDVDWPNRIISFFRQKTGSIVQIRFGEEVARILQTLPTAGPLFPYLRGADSRERANEFRERCRGLGINGISLHSYRYAWAERAKVAGYPERFAQLALGHNSKAVHRAYARKAQVLLPPLEDYERNAKLAPVVPIAVPIAG